MVTARRRGGALRHAVPPLRSVPAAHKLAGCRRLCGQAGKGERAAGEADSQRKGQKHTPHHCCGSFQLRPVVMIFRHQTQE